jgi:hypothetical protein
VLANITRIILILIISHHLSIINHHLTIINNAGLGRARRNQRYQGPEDDTTLCTRTNACKILMNERLN